MTDNSANIYNDMPDLAPIKIASRQQGADYARPLMVASPTPCSSEADNFVAHTSQTTPTRILRLPEVISRVGLRRASIYQHMAAGSFPKPIALGLRAVGWVEVEIDAWVVGRIAARRLPKA